MSLMTIILDHVTVNLTSESRITCDLDQLLTKFVFFVRLYPLVSNIVWNCHGTRTNVISLYSTDVKTSKMPGLPYWQVVWLSSVFEIAILWFKIYGSAISEKGLLRLPYVLCQ